MKGTVSSEHSEWRKSLVSRTSDARGVMWESSEMHSHRMRLAGLMHLVHFLKETDWMHKKMGPSGCQGSWSLKPGQAPGEVALGQKWMGVKARALRGGRHRPADLGWGLGTLLTQSTARCSRCAGSQRSRLRIKSVLCGEGPQQGSASGSWMQWRFPDNVKE